MIQTINNNDNIFPKNILKNTKKPTLKKDSKKIINKFVVLKNAIKFYQKFFSQENGIIKTNENNKPKNKSSAEILNNKIIEEIEKEKNKLILQKKRNSISSSSNLFFKFGIKTKIKSNNLEKYYTQLNNMETTKRTKISKDNLKIKSLKRINSDIFKKIRNSNVKVIKKEMKELETLDITNLIKKSKNKIKNNYKRRKGLYASSLNFEISKIKENIKKQEYQNKFRNLFLCDNLFDSLDDDENENLEKMPIFFIGPNDALCYIIDSMALIISIISLIYIPYFLAFNLNECKYNYFSGVYAFFLFNDLIYFIDLITGFFRAFYNFEEFLIVKKRYMILNYLKGWFIFDLIEAIPYLLILNSNKEFCKNKKISHNFSFGNNLNYSYLLLKIFKIFKTFKNSAIKAINKFLSKNNFYSDWKDVFSYVIIILCTLHIARCYFIYLGNNIYPGWFAEGLQSESNKDIYIASIYYVVTTLTTVGYGDIIVKEKYQRIFQIVLLIVGTLSYSWLLTCISNYIKKNNEKYIVYEEKVKILEEIKINYPNLSNNLYERITRYLRYNKSRYKYNIKYMLDSLPLSIQNNLIIEIYKPIIKNFFFFKHFENSDFLVKIVTSMKPILSMKDDILINEGDVIDDIIFIKNGRLSLEANIYLDDFNQDLKKSKSIIKNRIDSLSYFRSTNITKNEEKNYFNSYLNFTKKITNGIKMEKQYPKKQIKIIELRSNEHFGDVLMILNEKSPVTMKVKSSKAELLFLQKIDATEISNLYPNIWKKIVTKSLYNLNKIKYIIKKKVILYCELNDIPLNEEFKKNFSNQDKKIKLKNGCCTKLEKRIKSIIKEVDESKYLSPENSNTSKKILSIKKFSLNSSKKEDKSDINFLKEKRKKKINKTKISNKIKNKLKDNNLILDLNKNNINSFIVKNENINKEKNEMLNQVNKESQKIKDENLERINEEIYFNEELVSSIINQKISMNNYDKNNKIFNKKITENNDEIISKNNSFDKIYKLLNDNEISNHSIKKLLLNNNSVHNDKENKNINIYNNTVINNSHKNENTITNINYTKTNKFDILENTSTNSFSINSTYENINKISKYKYASNKSFQLKIKKYCFNHFHCPILEQ